MEDYDVCPADEVWRFGDAEAYRVLCDLERGHDGPHRSNRSRTVLALEWPNDDR